MNKLGMPTKCSARHLSEQVLLVSGQIRREKMDGNWVHKHFDLLLKIELDPTTRSAVIFRRLLIFFFEEFFFNVLLDLNKLRELL